jgi:hypothetical protein
MADFGPIASEDAALDEGAAAPSGSAIQYRSLR